MHFFIFKRPYTFSRLAIFCFLVLLLPSEIFSQVSNVEAYKKKVYQTMASGSSNVFSCSEPETKDLKAANRKSKSSLAISCATAFQGGYGTNCWNDTNTDPDPACSIPAVPSSDCNGGKYRIPIAITIFECFDWAGTNYIETEDGGFEPILNLDLNNRLVEVNELFANSNIEFYEINRQRVQDCDLYDFYQSTEPSTGFNDSNDDLVESVSYDIPNAINIYFVGGLFGDHDCCGTMAFAPYPPGRDYTVLRYGTAVQGSNLAHELGHYFGLPHTYAQSIDFPVIDGDGVPTGALDNCDCLTEGDRICDTWPDPSFGHNCNHLGAGSACYMAGGSSCDFDEAAYAAHIAESHEGVSPNLLISPNSGTTFSTTSSTVLSQNIMSNNFIFGCTTTFSPCQYKKIHDVARSDCRNYLCNTNTSDYFQSTTVNAPNTSNYEICIGDEIPTFQAGNTISRFDGSQYSLDCFDWYMDEFDEQSEAILVNSSSFTPAAGQININEAGTYEFWVAEVNALNDPPCKVKVTITVADNPGTAITTTNEGTINACTENNLTIEARGTSIDSTVDIIGWYFSDANPTETFTTGVAAQTAIQSATNSNNWNAVTGNIVQSDVNNPLSNLSNVSIDCNTLAGDDRTYFLTPFIAKGAIAQDCSASSTSSSFNWNIAGGFTGGATVNLGPIHDCSVSGLLVDDFSVTLSINNCETVGGDIGARIYFNRGTELSINTPFDFTFDCTQNEIVISENDLRNIKADYDPMRDQLQINFINTNFFRTNFQGTIDLNLNARIDVNYSGDNAQVIWDTNNRPNIDTSNMDCFWGTPITVLCDCENSVCPEIGEITGSTTICSGDINPTLAVDGIQNIGNFNMEFVYFTERQTDSSLYVNIPNGILGNGLVVEQVFYPTEAGTYYVYARLNPVPVDMVCRPFQELVIEVVDIPASPVTEDILYCEGDTIIPSIEGTNLRWYDTPIGGDGRADPMFNLAVLDTQSYWVSQTINACESSRSKLDIIRVERPNPPNIPDVSLCMGDESSELVEGIPNLRWYATETSDIGTSEPPVVNSAIAGTTTYWVSRSSNCESERVPVVVTINAFPTSPIVQDVFYCLGATAEPLHAGGGNLRWYDSFSDGIGTDIAPTPRTDSIGVFNYMVSQTINGCESNQAVIKVTISDKASSPIVNNVSVCQGTPITLDVQGTNLKWFDSPTDSTSSDTIPVPMTNLIGTQSFWVSQIIGGCESERVEVQAIINEVPQSPVISNVNYFLNEAAVPLTAIGNQLLWYTDASDEGITTAPVPTTDSIGTQIYRVSQTANNCESEQSFIVVTVQEREMIEVITEIILPINGSNGSILISGLHPDTSYVLSYIKDNIVVVDTVNTSLEGTIVIGNLESGNYNNITLNLDGEIINLSDIDLPSAACNIVAEISGADTICLGETVPLNITITNGKGPYQLILSDGTNNHEFSDYINGSVISFTPDSTTTYTLIQLIDSDSCVLTENIDPITISVNNILVPLVTPIMYCVGSEASPLTAEGVDLKWYTAAIGGTGQNTIIPSTDTAGIQQFWVSQTIDGCESARSVLEVSVQAKPVVPAVRSTNICVGEEVGLIAEGENLRWYETAVGGEGFDILIPTTDSAGVQQFWVSQTINGCESDRILMNLIVNALPSAPITKDSIIRIGTSILLTAEGENLQWYNSETGGSAVDLIISDPTIAGVQTYWVSQTINNCESDRTPVNITVIDEVSLGLGVIVLPTDTTNGSIQLTELLADTAYTLIYSVDGDTITTTITTDVDGNYVITDLAAGSYSDIRVVLDGQFSSSLVVTLVQETCTLSVTFSENNTICPGETSNISIAIENGSNPYHLVISDGFNMLDFPSYVSGTSISVMPTTTSVYSIVSLEDRNGCQLIEEDNTGQVIISVQETTPPITTDVTSCMGVTELASLSAIGNNLLWYTTAVGGEGSSTAPTPDANIAGVTTYWVSQTINGCEGPRARIEVTIDGTKPNPPIVESVNYCQGDETLPFNVQGENLRWYVLPIGGVGTVETPHPTSELVGIYYYWVSQNINGCESDRARIAITIDEVPTPEIGLVVSPTPCFEDGFLQLKSLRPNTTYQLSYTFDDRPETPYMITTTDNGTYLLTGLAAGNYTDIRVQSGNCRSVALQQELKENAPPLSAFFTDDATICKGETANIFLTIGGGTIPYDIVISDINRSYSIPNYVNGNAITVLPTETAIYYLISITDGNGCTTVFGNEAVRITVLDCASGEDTISTKPNPPIVESVNYCQGDEILPFNVQGENLRWYVLPSGGVGTTTPPQPTSNLRGIYYYWVSQSINGRESDRARIAITIDEVPTPEIGLVVSPTPCSENGFLQLKNLLPNTDYQLSYTLDNRPEMPYVITTTDNGTYLLTDLAAGNYTDIQVQSGNCSSVTLQRNLEDSGDLVSVDFVGDTTICEGGAATMFLNIEDGVAPYNLVISDINQTYSLSNYESGEGITIDPTETTSYFLISVTDNTGCPTIFGNKVVRITVSDCISAGSFQDGSLENATNLFSLNNQKLKKSEDFELFQNKPNPFSNQTSIGFYLPTHSEVELVLRDNTGRIIKRSKQIGTSGVNHITIDDLGEIQGLIYYQLITDFGTKSKKMLLVR